MSLRVHGFYPPKWDAERCLLARLERQLANAPTHYVVRFLSPSNRDGRYVVLSWIRDGYAESYTTPLENVTPANLAYIADAIVASVTR